MKQKERKNRKKGKTERKSKDRNQEIIYRETHIRE